MIHCIFLVLLGMIQWPLSSSFGTQSPLTGSRLPPRSTKAVCFAEEKDKVKVWGVWLDADVAGASRPPRVIQPEDGRPLTDAEKGEVFYEEARVKMDQGKYDVSRALLDKAIELVGEETRRGGEFKLWLSQAYQACGPAYEEQAIKTLKSLKSHPDKDVKGVADKLRFILEAPQIALTKDDFVEFPDTSELKDSYGKGDKLIRPRDKYAEGYKSKPWRYEMVDNGPPPALNPAQDLAAFAVATLAIAGMSFVLLAPH